MNKSLTFCLAFLLAASLQAQLNKATLTGIVVDPSGAAIAGARITAVQLGTNTTFSTTTTATGNYALPALEIGLYRIETEAVGFKRSIRDGVTLESGATLRLDVAMEIGAVSEAVEVSARASALETESTRVSTNLTRKLVEDLPLVVSGQIRNVFNLALIAPETKTGANGQFRIGGGQTASWEMTMDGVSLTSASTAYQYERAPISSAPVDAIQEFAVESTGMKAEYGRSMGTVSFTTKSGTNQVHGNAFEFLRNNATDARGFFAQSTPVLKQHDFGFTFGGPVYIPKVYNGKNKSFFFVSYEGFRNRAGNNPSYSTVPLPGMYNGDFSGWVNSSGMIPLYDPASTTLGPDGKTYVRDAFAGNQIPVSRFSTVAKNYIALRPSSMVPNVAGSGPTLNFFSAQGGNITPWNKGTIRGDHQIGAQNHLSFLFLKGEKDDDFALGQPPGLPNPFNGNSVWSRKNTSYRLSWDRTLSARIVNSLRGSFQREHGVIENVNSVDANQKWNAKLGIPNTPGPDHALPAMAMSQYTTWSGNAWGGDYGRNFNLNDDVTIVKGSHTFKAGGFFSADHWWGVGQHRPNGDFSFSSLATAIPGDQSNASGNGFASMLLGYPDRAGLETPRAVLQTYNYYGGFFQDDWHVNHKLTLNLGLRYEYTSPVGGGAILGLTNWEASLSGKTGGFENFDPSVPNPAAGGRPGAVVYSGNCSDGCSGKSTLFDSFKKAWGPRFGLAYQVRSGTVVRMYAARSFAALKTTGGSTHYDGLILNTDWSSQDRDIVNFPTLLDKGLPPWTAPPYRSPSVDNNATVAYWQTYDAGRPPEYYTWGFDIQHQLPGNIVFSLGYAATKGVHLDSSVLNINQLDPKYLAQYGQALLLSNINSPAARAANIPIPYAGFNSSVAQALRPFPQFNDVQTNGSSVGERAGNSNYQSMMLKVDKRYSSGLTVLFSYVFSKLLADTDNASSTGRQVMDGYNRRLEKSLSADDQTHVFRNALTYDLPIGEGKALALHGITDKLLGSWSLSGFQDYESGTPYSVAPGISPVPTAGNRVSISSYTNWTATSGGFDPFKNVWWNKAAFGVDASGSPLSTAALNSIFGNATRTNPKARAPWILNENVSLAKNFKVTERIRITFRAEGFNLLNRVRWGTPDSTVTSSAFGIIRSQANNPRQMQFALKFNF